MANDLTYGINIGSLLNLKVFDNVLENIKENVIFPLTTLRVICMANTEKTK